MRLLLDTHVVLWALAKAGQLSERAAAVILREDEVFVSAASLWEIEIKRALGKLDAPDDLEVVIEASGFRSLPIAFRHATRAGALPRHHGDPFDRMLVAQAQLEGLTLVTSDAAIAAYQVAVLPAS